MGLYPRYERVSSDGRGAWFVARTDRGLAVGLVPAGNANVVAQEFGLSGKLHSVLEVLDRGEDRALDALCVQADRRELGRALAMVGVGWEGRTARWVGWTRSRAGGGRIYRNALGADGLYLACGLAAMVRLGLPRLAIEVDGEPLAGSFADVEVSNVATYAKRMRLCPDARADDGWLDLQLRRHGFPPTVAAALACAGVGARAPRFLAQLHRARRVRVVSDSDFEWQLDGDFAGQSRELEVSVLPQSWLLRVPSTPRCPHARETVAGT